MAWSTASQHAAAHREGRGGANALLHFGVKKTKRLRIKVSFGENAYEAVLEPSAKDRLIFASETAYYQGEDHPRSYEEPLGEGQKESGLEEEASRKPNKVADHVLKAMRGWKVFQFHDTSATAGIKQKHAIGDSRVLQPDGANLAALLFGLKKRAPKKYRAIVDVIRAVAPFFDDFLLEPDELDRKVIQLEWRHKSDPSYFDASSLSDGTLRFMCLAALLLQPTKPSVIVIDEPELGLHPAAIVQLAALLRLASRESQVIVATQSVTLLDQFASEDVIVVERSNGESTFERLAKDQVRGWLDDYSLGELWLKNVLGGRPS
jgi:predicted ATPase